MEVIRHEHIRVERTAKALGEVCEVVEEKTIVVLGKEAGLPVVSTLDDVHWHSSDLEAALTGERSAEQIRKIAAGLT
jgi:hypothetical protein